MRVKESEGRSFALSLFSSLPLRLCNTLNLSRAPDVKIHIIALRPFLEGPGRRYRLIKGKIRIGQNGLSSEGHYFWASRHDCNKLCPKNRPPVIRPLALQRIGLGDIFLSLH
jgi:hypothetical protein